ncbi:MAG: hypothetical protein JJU16_01715 [Alkalibacterium sp.]|nr:hypothetical protein [Alkalibacterium sp.]
MKKKTWFILLISVLTLLLLVTGLAVFLPDHTEEAIPLEEELPQEDMNDILIIGDSIGSGVGDGEKSGLGERYLELLDEDIEDETLTNLSVSGYDSSQLVTMLASGEHNAAIAEADLIVISIGGNDLNSLAFQRNINLPVAFEETLNTYTHNLEEMTSEIRDINPDAQLALIGLYNPYSLIVPELTSYLLEWTDQTRSVVESDPGFTYVPTYDVFQDHLEDYLFVDFFHPNEEGYQVIAEQLYTLLN